MHLNWIVGPVTACTQGEVTDPSRRKLNWRGPASGFYIRIDFMLGDRKNVSKPADGADQCGE